LTDSTSHLQLIPPRPHSADASMQMRKRFALLRSAFSCFALLCRVHGKAASAQVWQGVIEARRRLVQGVYPAAHIYNVQHATYNMRHATFDLRRATSGSRWHCRRVAAPQGPRPLMRALIGAMWVLIIAIRIRIPAIRERIIAIRVLIVAISIWMTAIWHGDSQQGLASEPLAQVRPGSELAMTTWEHSRVPACVKYPILGAS
jgi:hypothetical protein